MNPSTFVCVSELVAQPTTRLQRLVLRARRLQALDRAFRERIGAPLNHHCRVANVEGDTATLHVDSPVWASRVRFLGPAVLGHLRELCAQPGLRSLSIRVRPPNCEAAAAPRRGAGLPAEAAALLRSVAQETADPGLRGVLLRLAGRAR